MYIRKFQCMVSWYVATIPDTLHVLAHSILCAVVECDANTSTWQATAETAPHTNSWVDGQGFAFCTRRMLRFSSKVAVCFGAKGGHCVALKAWRHACTQRYDQCGPARVRALTCAATAAKTLQAKPCRNIALSPQHLSLCWVLVPGPIAVSPLAPVPGPLLRDNGSMTYH